MRKLNGPTRLIKQRYDICVFDKNNGEPILYKRSNYRYWYADPFLAEENGKAFCFVELMDNHVKHGEIARLSMDGKLTKVVSEPYHLSWPYIFKYGDKWLMMPESSGNKDLRLYIADSLEGEWSYYKTLLEGVTVCDSVIFELDGGHYLLTYDFSNVDEYKAVFYHFDISSLMVGEFINYIPDRRKVLRPAGKAFCDKDTLILPTQKGTDSYGEDVIFNEIVRNADGTLSVNKINYSVAYPAKIVARYDHKHTYNAEGDKAVLDFSKLVFSPMQIIDGLPCTFKRLFRRGE
jgi:hypothetical protein